MECPNENWHNSFGGDYDVAVSRKQAISYVGRGGMDPFIRRTANYIAHCRATQLTKADAKSYIHEWVMEAVHSYDPNRGASFPTWCIHHIGMRTRKLVSRARENKKAMPRRLRTVVDIAHARAGELGVASFDAGRLSSKSAEVWKELQAHLPGMPWRGINPRRIVFPEAAIAKRTGISEERLVGLFDEVRSIGLPEQDRVRAPAFSHNSTNYSKMVFAK